MFGSHWAINPWISEVWRNRTVCLFLYSLLRICYSTPLIRLNTDIYFCIFVFIICKMQTHRWTLKWHQTELLPSANFEKCLFWGGLWNIFLSCYKLSSLKQEKTRSFVEKILQQSTSELEKATQMLVMKICQKFPFLINCINSGELVLLRKKILTILF